MRFQSRKPVIFNQMHYGLFGLIGFVALAGVVAIANHVFLRPRSVQTYVLAQCLMAYNGFGTDILALPCSSMVPVTSTSASAALSGLPPQNHRPPPDRPAPGSPTQASPLQP
jgi:hypothetical protein